MPLSPLDITGPNLGLVKQSQEQYYIFGTTIYKNNAHLKTVFLTFYRINIYAYHCRTVEVCLRVFEFFIRKMRDNEIKRFYFFSFIFHKDCFPYANHRTMFRFEIACRIAFDNTVIDTDLETDIVIAF